MDFLISLITSIIEPISSAFANKNLIKKKEKKPSVIY